MALIPCKNCGALVSDKADACPICNTPLNEKEVTEKSNIVEEVVVPPPITPMIEEKTIQKEKMEGLTQTETIQQKDSSNKKVYIGIVVGLLAIVRISPFLHLGF